MACHRPAGPDTTGLPTPAKEGFPHGRWAPATPPTTPRATPRGQASRAFQTEPSGIGAGSLGREAGTLLWGRRSGSRARGMNPARVRETQERGGGPPRPAGPGPDHSLRPLRAPSPAGRGGGAGRPHQTESRHCLSVSPPPAGRVSVRDTPPGAQDPSRQGHQGNTVRASEGAGQPHARVTRVTRHTPGGRRGPR